jgi:ADP-ribosylglycohydrolase/protein-tyrosine phosphatase
VTPSSWKLDRLGRNTLHILETVKAMTDRGVTLISTTDGIDSSTAAGRMMIGVLGSLAEYERELIIERTALKREASRSSGVRFGRPKKVADTTHIATAKRMKTDGHTARDVAKFLGISRATFTGISPTKLRGPLRGQPHPLMPPVGGRKETLPMTLTTAQLDRACGVLLGTAAGDALGAPYEFGPPRRPELEVAMVGGGSFGWEPGEWTDDTSMAIGIAEVAATGADLRQEQALDAIGRRWHEWSQDAKDVGVQTRSVLSRAGRHGISAQTAREESAALHKFTGRTAGNGSLMRTAPVALAYLDDEAAVVEAARAVSDLTHYDPEAGDASVLWCCAIRHAILTGVLDARIGLQHIDLERRDLWAARLDAAEKAQPSDFTNNGWVVEALQAAWSAITTTPIPTDHPAEGVFRADHLRLALDAAVRGGGDTDTVAAIAGGLLAAAYGASAVPGEWRRVLHGWPGLATRDLAALATRIVKADKPFSYDIEPMAPVRHPHDDGVWLGDVGTLRELPLGVDAVVSLCRVNGDDLPSGVEQIDIRLIDIADPEANPNLDFVLTDTVRLIEQLRNEGRTVLLHCVACQSRTPTVAALYGARKMGISGKAALQEVISVLPDAYPNSDFREALQRLAP